MAESNGISKAVQRRFFRDVFSGATYYEWDDVKAPNHAHFNGRFHGMDDKSYPS